jgi:hypothetical protein
MTNDEHSERQEALGPPVQRPVGRLVPERAAFDAWFAAATFETMGRDWTWAGWQAGSRHARERCASACEHFAAALSDRRVAEALRDMAALFRELER